MRVGADRIFAPLRQRDFALLWAGLAVSLIGDGIYYVAVAWQAYALSNAPAALSMLGVAWTAPTVLFLLLGGSVSDRLERRHVMAGASIVQAMSLTAIGMLDLGGLLTLPLLLGLVALAGAAMGFFSPALVAVVPSLVSREELAAASALEYVVRPISLQLAGPALGGALIALAGTGVAFLVDAASFGFAALTIIAMRPARCRAVSESTARLSGIVEALRFVRANPWLWGTLLAAGLSLFAVSGPSQVLLPYLIKNQLHLGGGAFGAIRALAGLGALAAGLAVGRAGLPQRFITIMFAAWALQALGAIGYGLASDEWGLALISFASGLGVTLGNVIWGTLMRTHVPNELLGRVSSVDWLMSIGLVPVSFAITAPLVAALGAQLTLIIAGAAACFVMVLAGLAPRMRELEAGQIAID